LPVTHVHRGVVVEQRVVVLDRAIGHEVERVDGTESSYRTRVTVALHDPPEAVSHLFAETEDVRVDVTGRQAVDRGERRRAAARMPVESPREEDVAADTRVEALHQLSPAADRRNGESVRDRLAHRGEVRDYAANRLIAADVVAKAGDHLVENENDAF